MHTKHCLHPCSLRIPVHTTEDAKVQGALKLAEAVLLRGEVDLRVRPLGGRDALGAGLGGGWDVDDSPAEVAGYGRKDAGVEGVVVAEEDVVAGEGGVVLNDYIFLGRSALSRTRTQVFRAIYINKKAGGDGKEAYLRECSDHQGSTSTGCQWWKS